MKFLSTVLGLASVANAHTLFTTFYVDGKNQGDGTCVRQPEDAATANGPIYPITGDVMACGRDGDKPAKFICPAPGGAQLTFHFREAPAYHRPGAIAEGHKGPCSVYVKKVDNILTDSAAGAGWFKIWEDGYDVKEGTWCTDRLRANNGLLSVDLPTGLPSGYYLVRPEVLALHNAPAGDPQFYQGCAQIFIENGPSVPLQVPEKYEVSIPGYVNKDTPGLTFNIYEKPLGEYPIPGPDVWVPTSEETGTKQTQKYGVIPSDCLVKNGNWCAKPMAKYSGQEECWAAAKECWSQGDVCWKTAAPSGGANCEVWSDYCKEMNNQCENKNFEGPPKFTGKEVFAKPGPIPAPYDGTEVNKDGEDTTSSVVEKPSTTKAAAPAKTTASAPKVSAPKAEPETVEYNEDAFPAYEETPTGYLTAPTSTYASKPKQTSSVPVKEGSSGLKVSKDGRCGGETGQTCEGSSFGNCCSKKGRCGRKSRHCDCGCQNAFGICGE
ncbi:hypothetical protein MRS44_006554 [Fusarium solani]|uniref:lytic cellulose monooxygenase (C4-dehydrogenating) n=1 Tax=Fusarium solani TaxID=169388 RepID=A0A9P9L7B8_FUSSL|nr:glycosyl hydrolase family 61-domain-containing protein [Fusarium solani]KAH7275224.1 glycosyl hydrolase family 61-domain-containing protein [Fusarium solani]KAJ3465896.1 hypothetical protein MRS44_006554 [Fusarium solani]